MHRTPRPLLRGLACALMGLTVLGSATIAQSDTTTISIPVLPYDCQQEGSMGITAISDGESSIAPGATESGVDVFDWNLSLQLNLENAGCGQWTVTAELTDFELDSDPSKSFSASTLHIARDSSIPADYNPARWSDQPDWVLALPSALPIGNPVMPAPLAQDAFISESRDNSVTFSGDPATSTSALLESSSEAFGSPGYSSAYYRMRFFDLPADLYLNPGKYSADITISVQGAD